jgi:hypothetical protein
MLWKETKRPSRLTTGKLALPFPVWVALPGDARIAWPRCRVPESNGASFLQN